MAALYLVAIFGLPAGLLTAGFLVVAPLGSVAVLPLAVAAPLLGALLFVVVAGLLSRPHQHVDPGPADSRAISRTRPTARGASTGSAGPPSTTRRPIYFVALSHPVAQAALTFRLFGYRGQMDFTVYPDTWIRDLPLLDFGQGRLREQQGHAGHEHRARPTARCSWTA